MAKKKLYDLPQEVAGVVKNTIPQPRQPAPSFPQGAPVITRATDNTTTPKPGVVIAPPDPNRSAASVAKSKEHVSPADVGVKIIRDDKTGKLNGIVTPDGKSILGLPPREVMALYAKYYGGGGVDNSMAQYAQKPLTPEQAKAQHEQGLKDKYLMDQADNALIASITPPNISAEQKAQIGQLDPNIINGNTPVDTQIAENVYQHNRVDNLTDPLQRLAALPGSINKLTAFAGQLPGGTSIINALSQDRKAREYLLDYNNKDNLQSIRGNIGTANIQITDAITYAKMSVNNEETTKIATQMYNEAVSRKYKAIAQLSAIAKGDQRAYTDSIKDDLTELELYFNGGNGMIAGKIADDNMLFAALNKPTPKYLNTGGGLIG